MRIRRHWYRSMGAETRCSTEAASSAHRHRATRRNSSKRSEVPMPTYPTTPIDHPSAWTAEDLRRDRSWVIPLTGNDLDELASGLEAIKTAGLGPIGFDRKDFPLGRFTDTLTHVADEIEHGRGIVLFKGLNIEDYTLDELRTIYWGMTLYLGEMGYQNAAGDLLGEVIDRGFDRRNNNVRGYTTAGQQRYHCDQLDAVGLLCVHPAKSGGESRLASSIALFNHILEHHPDYLDLLCEGFHYDLRGEGVTGERDEVTFNKIPVFSWYDGRMSCRYNGKTIQDGMRKAGAPLNDDEVAIVEYVREIADTDTFRYDMKFEAGDIQYLSNYGVLHSRTGFEDWPDENRRRRLFRIWFNMHNGRKLDPVFADKNNTGPRGGIKPIEGAGYWADEALSKQKGTEAVRADGPYVD
ncbi:MAG: hypothetical protein CMM48_02635 [Rhodospirillaceae bacterium]|nr:hypothetical protein [Rhodospirillaceae bacterium]